MSNLFSTDPSTRVLGFDPDEKWMGHDQFMEIFRAQSGEMENWDVVPDTVEAFEEDGFGWAMATGTLRTSEAVTPIRHTAVLRLEDGTWRILQWQNSVPVPNEQIWGIPLTTTLDDLVSAIHSEEYALVSEVASEGTVTLVFTDVVGSTSIADRVGDPAWVNLIHRLEAAATEITTAENGTVVKFLGDGSMLAFDSARAAVRAAIRLQEMSTDTGLKIRIGIHTGEAVRTDGDILGTTVNKAARIAAAAEPGQIILSSTTADLIGTIYGVTLSEPRNVAIRGLPGQHQIVPIEWSSPVND